MASTISKNYFPSEDGQTHINIWSGANTQLGKMLSHFTRRPFYIDGEKFESLEGYWYWLSLYQQGVPRENIDILKELFGTLAKTEGRGIRRDFKLEPGINDAFWDTFAKAVKISICSDENLRTAFVTSTLPFAHYYAYESRVIVASEEERFVELYENLREQLGS